MLFTLLCSLCFALLCLNFPFPGGLYLGDPYSLTLSLNLEAQSLALVFDLNLPSGQRQKRTEGEEYVLYSL